MLKNKTGFSFMAAPNKQTNSHKVLLLLMYCDFFVASFWWQTVLGYKTLDKSLNLVILIVNKDKIYI